MVRPLRRRVRHRHQRARHLPGIAGRRRAKVWYVVLASVFAGGFVFLGVGSGSTGIGDLLQGHLFGSGGTSTSSQIDDKQQAIERSPKNVQLYIDLASLYQ